MTVAALAGLVLRDALAAGIQNLARRYFAAAAKVGEPGMSDGCGRGGVGP